MHRVSGQRAEPPGPPGLFLRELPVPDHQQAGAHPRLHVQRARAKHPHLHDRGSLRLRWLRPLQRVRSSSVQGLRHRPRGGLREDDRQVLQDERRPDVRRRPQGVRRRIHLPGSLRHNDVQVHIRIRLRRPPVPGSPRDGLLQEPSPRHGERVCPLPQGVQRRGRDGLHHGRGPHTPPPLLPHLGRSLGPDSHQPRDREKAHGHSRLRRGEPAGQRRRLPLHPGEPHVHQDHEAHDDRRPRPGRPRHRGHTPGGGPRLLHHRGGHLPGGRRILRERGGVEGHPRELRVLQGLQAHPLRERRRGAHRQSGGRPQGGRPPRGATGVRQAYECFKQLRGEAGGNQVDVPLDIALCHNIGGTGGIATVHILRRDI